MTSKDILNQYTLLLGEICDLKRPIRAVLDCSNGTTGIILRRLKIPNSKFLILNSNPDGRFPAHGPDPSKTGALNQLSRAVKNFRADLGIAFDADGDRAIFTDEKGDPVGAYLIFYLLTLNSPPPFVADILIFETLKYSGLLRPKTCPSKIGSYFVKKEMIKRRAGLGGELSGHYYHQQFYYLDDGLFTAIKVMNAVSKLPYPLSAFKDLLPIKISTELTGFRTDQPQKFIQIVKKRYGRLAKKILTLDGLTLEFQKGWLTVRPSNTEPLIRAFIGKIL